MEDTTEHERDADTRTWRVYRVKGGVEWRTSQNMKQESDARRTNEGSILDCIHIL